MTRPTRPQAGRPRHAPSTRRWRQWLSLPSRRSGAEDDGAVRTRASVRIAWVGAIVGAGYLALVGRASTLMLLPNPQLEDRASTQFERSVEVQGRRGDLVDRNGRILATTVNLYELHIDPLPLQQPLADGATGVDDPIALLASILAEELGVDATYLAGRFAREGRRDVLVAKQLTPAELAHVKARVSAVAKAQDGRLNGVVFGRFAPSRYYPGKGDAAPLIGIVGKQGHGRGGLELTLDDKLQGQTYKYVKWRDRKGRSISPDELTAQPGQTVVLTLDRRIQRSAERSLQAAMERTGAQSAYLTVIDIPTGEILALASVPGQNPNDTTQLSPDLFKNHAVEDAIEPGSVFKPFVAAAAVEEGLKTPSSPVDCEGGAWRVGGRTIHDDHPHGVVTLTEVIKYSSNIGTAKLALQLGPQTTLSYLKDFGFSRYSGLDLPGETRGQMRSPDRIRDIELATTAYGHGVTATSLQLASAVAALGNNGVRMKPRLVRAIQNAHGDVIETFLPEEDRQVVSAKTARATVKMMETVTERGGTGTRARIPGYRVAGKTGTAWKHVDGAYSSTDRIGSFVGVVPAEAPRLAIAVTVDTPTIGSSYGGIVAGPVFSEVGAEALRVLGIPPNPDLLEDDDHSDDTDRPAEDPDEPIATLAPELIWSADGRLIVPDLAGLSLRDAISTLQGAGFALAIEGSGRVAQQSPTPGTPLAPGERVSIHLN